MNSSDLRQKYLNFFKSKGSQIVNSDSLVPANDPTLLFTGAGMNQFKDQFMGKNITYSMATTCQKCIRTGDIENVGVTARHHTFFEMLGNFSFGDYFKRQAITWAYEFLTKELNIDPTRLYFSVFENDEEAYNIWVNEVGVDPARVYKLGEADNFWPASAPSKGPNGPCGPCSEIFYDLGSTAGHGRDDSDVTNDSDRYIEIWNLVFTQYNRQDGGVLEPLPQSNIDTGMGLERVVAVLNGVTTNFDTDLFIPIMTAMADTAGIKYGDSTANDRRLKRIADHTRALTFCIADGVMPGNEGRGYVVRRLLRRASLDARNLGVEKPILYNLVNKVVDIMGGIYPDIVQRQDKIKKIIKNEEIKFQATLQQGLNTLDRLIDETKKAGSAELSGSAAFVLYDTYGFPVELAEELLKEAHLSLDMAGFKAEMQKQKELARAGSSMKGDVFAAGPMEQLKDFTGRVDFVGYETKNSQGTILAILKGDKLVNKLNAGEKALIVFDKTPFYGESGGQAGDRGCINSDGIKACVTDTQKTLDVMVHAVDLQDGLLSVGQTYNLSVEEWRRASTDKNHTATHLLQWALGKVLGSHVEQAGSQVTADGLRFDFSHFQAVTQQELAKVAHLVNEKIIAGACVKKEIKSIDQAKADGAKALFGEKYGDEVRVVTVGDGFSMELCGGTHVDDIAQIGLVKILSEQSVAAGVRRIEAVTGLKALEAIEKEQEIIKELNVILNTSSTDLVKNISATLAENKRLAKDVSMLKQEKAARSAAEQANNMQEINGIPYLTNSFEGVGGKELMTMLDGYKKTVESGVVLLGAVDGKKVGLACYVTKDLISKGIKAGDIIKRTAKIVGGGGGGRDNVAQAGGRSPEKLPEALAEIERILIEN